MLGLNLSLIIIMIITNPIISFLSTHIAILSQRECWF
jgi:hypothetical protein